MTEDLQNWLSALPFAIITLDENMRIIATNPEAEALFGKGLQGRPVITATRHPELLAALDAVYAGAARQKLTMNIAQISRELTLEVTVAALPDIRPRRAMVTFQDITALESVDQMRRDFVANVSHELKTPLTSILGFLEALRGPARNDAAASERFLSVMETEALRMNRLVHDLLSLSRVEAESRLPPRFDLDIAALAQSVVLSLTPMAEAQDTALTLQSTAPNITVKGDESQLRQMLNNLVENALKYGGSGGRVGIAITALDHHTPLRGPAVEICVSDQGSGIAAEHIPRLTERFYRVDTHRSREKGGTGLGLAIVKHVVSRHGGLLKIASTLGKGSRFSVFLPAQRDGARGAESGGNRTNR